jgi:ATP adenylyltransferase
MEKLYAPWRDEYHGSRNKKDKNKSECIFCKFVEQVDCDSENLVLHRLENVFVMLNSYPYNAGHILIIPKKHVNSLNELQSSERCELIETVNFYIEFLREALTPEGFNVGLNLEGKVAGGSIPEHLHIHVLPRWLGDTGFLPTLSNTQPISKDLNAMYKKLKEQLEIYTKK